MVTGMLFDLFTFYKGILRRQRPKANVQWHLQGFDSKLSPFWKNIFAL